jgi:hypothetical protein
MSSKKQRTIRHGSGMNDDVAAGMRADLDRASANPE